MRDRTKVTLAGGINSLKRDYIELVKKLKLGVEFLSTICPAGKVKNQLSTLSALGRPYRKSKYPSECSLKLSALFICPVQVSRAFLFQNTKNTQGQIAI